MFNGLNGCAVSMGFARLKFQVSWAGARFRVECLRRLKI